MVLIAHKSVRLPRRSILGAAAACVPALAALTACAGTNRTFSSATSTPAASAASRIETSAATSVVRSASSAVPATQAPVTGAARLTFETWGSIDEIKVRQGYTQQFVKDHPAIDITFTPTPQDYWNALQSRMAGGNAPDVYYLEPGHVVELHCRNALLALDPYVARDHFDLSDFYPAGPLEYTIDGKLWALNRDFANQDIFYNVDLFKKAGVPLPPKQFDAAGWTFDDFLAACQKLTAGSGSSQTYGFGVPHGWRAYMSFVWSDGGTLVSQDAMKPTIDQPNAVTGLQFLEDLVGKYKVAPTPAETKAQSINNLFYAGRLGMMVSIPAQLAAVRQGAKGFTWDVAPPPMGPHGTKRQVGGGGAGYGIYGQTRYPDQSWQFMQWITGVKVQEMEVDAATSMGSRLSVGEYFVKVNQGKDPANVAMFVEASKSYLHTDPHAANWLQIGDILTKQFAPLWDASQPAKDVATQTAALIAPLLLQSCNGQ